MTPARSKIVSVLGLVALLLVTPEVAEARPVPGVVTQILLDDRDFARMERGGVETLRFLIRWRELEPEPGRLDWSSIDHVLASGGTPGRSRCCRSSTAHRRWVAQSELRPPIDDAADRASWRSFLTALVGPHGPRGRLLEGLRAPARRSPAGRSGTSPTSTSTGTRSRPSASTRACSRSPPERSGPPIAAQGSCSPASRRYGAGCRGGDSCAGSTSSRGVKRDFDFVALHPYAPGLRLMRRQIELARRHHGHGRRLADAARDHRGRLGVRGAGVDDGQGPPRAGTARSAITPSPPAATRDPGFRRPAGA